MSRKSFTKRKITDCYFPTSSSQLNKSSIVQNLTPQVLVDNDDEAERLALRRESILNNTIVSTTSSDKHSSTRLSHIPELLMKQHISDCIKLNIKNKINAKNAFCLEMIDFITFMTTTSKSSNIDLQLASTSLDVMSKIYAYRVDGLYTNILKIAGAFDKQHVKDIETSDEPKNEEKDPDIQEKKKRKKNKHDIISTESALKGSIETSCPSQTIIGLGDSCTTDMLYQVVLKNHANSDFYYHLYNDVILDTVDNTTAYNKNFLEYIIPSVEDCSNLNICSPFLDMKLLNWSYIEKPEVLQMTQKNNVSRFQFDSDALDYSSKGHKLELRNCSNANKDEQNIYPRRRNSQHIENVVNLQDILATQISRLDKPSEYSFIEKKYIHWAGPSYWKIKMFDKSFDKSRVVKTCHQMMLKKKKEVVLNYSDHTQAEVQQKFLSGEAIKIKKETLSINWIEEKIALPEDIHYDLSQLYKPYLYHSMVMNHNRDNNLNMIRLSKDENDNYSNENNIAEYYSNSNTHSQEIQENNNIDELRSQKIFVQYVSCAKEIDMGQLKDTIWKSLTLPNSELRMDTQNETQIKNKKEAKGSKSFSMIYKCLPNALSKINTRILSLPIAFVSLLHLANEKSLKLCLLPDSSDIVIEED